MYSICSSCLATRWAVMNFPISGLGGDHPRSSVTPGHEVCVRHRRSALFLNRSYWPDVEATGQLLTSLCEGLTPEFDVRVLAGLPNAVVGHAEVPDWNAASERNGVRIHRVAHTAFPKKSLIGKGVNFLSFAWAARSALKSIQTPDVVVFETDPFLLAFAANRLQRRTNCKMIGYLQDIYPDVAVALGKVGNNWAVRRLRSSLFDIYRRCDQMVVLSQDMAHLLIDGGVPKERISIVPNWADTQQITPIEGRNCFRERHQLGTRFVAMYSGNLGLTQRLEEFVQAAQLLKDCRDIVFAFVGRGNQEAALRNLVRSNGLPNVLFFDYQSQSELCHSLSAASLHLVPLTTSLSRCLMPSKLYGILAAGRPFLTNAPEGSELHTIAATHHVGLTVKAGSPQAIADQIKWAACHPAELEVMGRNSRQLAIAQYSKEHSVARFHDIMQEVLT